MFIMEMIFLMKLKKYITESKEIFQIDSKIGIIDKELNNEKNKNKIKEFLSNRNSFILDINSYTDEFIYTNKSNASRCFYNFYTTKKNYKLMSLICDSLTNLHNDFNKINYPIFDVSIHLRLGDVKYSTKEINNNSKSKFDDLVKKLNEINCSNKKILLMVDREDGDIVKKLQKILILLFQLHF